MLKLKGNQATTKLLIWYKKVKIISNGPYKTCQSSPVILNRANELR